MSCEEQQEEEAEVLRSIYDGDECFKEVSPQVYQYKVVLENELQCFLVEVSWGENYPNELPTISLDTFFNKHILDSVKAEVVDKLQAEAQMLEGMAATYTILEYAKENGQDLMANQPTMPVQASTTEKVVSSADEPKVKQRKEQLTKNQKRKLYDRLDVKGEQVRGRDWADVIKHLSQTGKQAPEQQALAGKT